MDLKDHIRGIPDFPKPGILFYDISTLLAHPKAWHATIEQMAETVKAYKPDVLAGIESRGFLLAAPLAIALGTGFVMLRKKGKLPWETIETSYDLEYGSNTVAIHNRRTNVFFIGSNGYLTMGAGDIAYAPTLRAHFSLPRVAAV